MYAAYDNKSTFLLRCDGRNEDDYTIQKAVYTVLATYIVPGFVETKDFTEGEDVAIAVIQLRLPHDPIV